MKKRIHIASNDMPLARRAAFGCITVFAVYFAMSALAASLVIAEKVSEESMPQLAAGIAFVSTFVGALFAAGQGGRKRPLAGLITAGAMMAIKLIASALYTDGELFSGGSLAVFAGIIFAGIAAGLLCMGNVKKKTRKTA